MANGNINSKNEEVVDSYKDPEGITTEKLSFGLWYVENRPRLRFVMIFVLVLLSVGSWGMTLYNFGGYLYSGMIYDDKLVADIMRKNLPDHEYFRSISPQALVITDPTVFRDGSRFDLLARVRNLNQEHWATFKYRFTAGLEDLGEKDGFILPDEEKYFLELGNELGQISQNVQMTIYDVDWKRIDRHDIPDWPLFRVQHLDISFEDIKYSKEQDAVSNAISNIGELSFKAMNNSAYNYYIANINIILFNYGAPVGAYRYALKDFRSRESRELKIAWPSDINSAEQVQIIPDINILDNSSYSKFQAGSMEDGALR